MRSVRVRLTLWNVGIFAAVLLLFLLATHFAVRAFLVSTIDRRLESQGESFARIYERMDERLQRPPLDGQRENPRRFPSFGMRNGTFRWVRAYNQTGRLVLPQAGEPDENMTPWDDAAIRAALAGERSYSTIAVDGASLRVYSRPLLRNGAPAGALQVAFPLREMEMLNEGMMVIMMTLIPFMLIAAALGGLFLTGRVLSPVRKITKAAEEITAQDLSQRLPVFGDDEFAHLAMTMNRMMHRLQESFTQIEQAFEQERRFTADASHELRTPLTAIKANTSLALRGARTAEQYREALVAANKAADYMNKLVQDMLLLARSDSGQLAMEMQQITLADLCAGVISLFQQQEPLIAPVRCNIPPGLSLRGDEHHLHRLLTNLLENALRHTPAEGSVTLSARVEEDIVVLQIADTGEGIAAEHLPHLSERFYRVDSARSRQQGGSGLGLAIVQSIVDAHRGSIHFASVPGEGTTVTVRLPMK